MSKNKHSLVEQLMDYDNCPDDAVDAAAELIEKLIEIHSVAEGDWDAWMDKRSFDWYDEVGKLLEPFENNE